MSFERSSTPAIRIRRARTNNLRGIDIDIPRNALVVFAGLSGSGKSSLLFDTIAAEAGHQLNETFPPFVRNRLPKWQRPEVDHIGGLSTVVVIDQRRIGGNARSTVGTITDAYTYLRLLFSRIGAPEIGESNRFSFNDPAGMCPTCSGLGETVIPVVDRFIDLDRSLADGAILLPGFGSGKYWYAKYAGIGSFDADTPLRDWTVGEREALLYGGEAAARLGTAPPSDYQGILERFERIYLRTSDNLSDAKRAVLNRFTDMRQCPQCGGDRLNETARAVTVRGHTISQLSNMEISELTGLIPRFTEPSVEPVVEALHRRLTAITDIGLGYLNLARATTTLSGGESQRIKTIRHLGSSLIEMLYIFDEPTIGLHPSDVTSMTNLLRKLADQGNTVLVVEHDPQVMSIADQIVELGPGAGTLGGELVFQGSWSQLTATDTVTARALRAGRRTPAGRRPTGKVTVTHAARNNLRDLTVDIPLGVLTVLTGVAGSGKSSLAAELVAQHEATIIDQRPVSTSRRSTPLTYTGIAPDVRKLFAKANGVSPTLFSANSAGGCPECDGLGVIYTDLAFMDGQETVCGACHGRRFSPEALSHTLDGLTIADIDELTVAEAVDRLPHASIGSALRQITSVGLGYLRLGQPLNTLSGGECQRLKIARELSGDSVDLYVLDEPTTGLHLRDIDTLLDMLDGLVRPGTGVVVIEHHLDVIRHADWVVDLGPGAGRHGGRVLFEGEPADLATQDSPTGRALRDA
ncbi:excinuclease ABC A subunit [Stackebrandtia endophytica]|uniref:UvrABC system protein A n=1 Tax=Stackebrandtia endophytica TaxID=1496996 RepID=A0A543AQ27_9ACTN|nr:excinuclease ABC subunit UvrA [Stackebrandtia endophytica]TQL74701.1 excinuclease ABC A subunit [Stackebrandtia endophytica]